MRHREQGRDVAKTGTRQEQVSSKTADKHKEAAAASAGDALGSPADPSTQAPSPSDRGTHLPPVGERSRQSSSPESAGERRKRVKVQEASAGAREGRLPRPGSRGEEAPTANHDRIKVCVRKRPLSAKEHEHAHKDIINCNSRSGSGLTVLEYRKRLDLTEYVGEASGCALAGDGACGRAGGRARVRACGDCSAHVT